MNEGCFWAVKLDVRDLGGHLDVTLAGTLSSRVKIATTQVPAVGALPLGFQRMLVMVRSKYLPGGLFCDCHNTPALLSLLDGPWGSDPAFFIIWSRFRQLRRYLAYRPDE